MKAKPALLAAIASLLQAQVGVAANDELPTASTFARYESMSTKFPFAVSAAPVASPTNAFRDLYISSMVNVGDESVLTLRSAVDKIFKAELHLKKGQARIRK